MGAGEVGQRKVKGLLEAQAKVRLIGREQTDSLKEMTASDQVEFYGPEYDPSALDGVVLVIACTNNRELNARVSKEAEKLGLWVNVADDPELCGFILPALVKRGDLVIGVSTSGQSPALAAKIRRELEDDFGTEYEEFLILMGLIRKKFLENKEPEISRKKVFYALVNSELLSELSSGKMSQAEKIIIDILGPRYAFESLGYTPEIK